MTEPRKTPLRPTPSTSDILSTIAEIAREKVGRTGTLSTEMRLIEDLALDSIRLLTLAIEIEDRFRICLDEEDEAEIETVGDLVAAVAGKLGDSRVEGGEEEDR